KKFKLLFFMSLIFIFASCESSIDVNVNSKNNLTKKTKSVYLINSSYYTQDSDYYEGEIKKVLLSHGLIIAKNAADSDLILFVSYGVTEPFEKTVFFDCDNAGGGGTEKITVFYNYISFTGIETKSYKGQEFIKPQVKSYVSYYSSTYNFKLFFPHMLEAITPYIGKNLEKPLTINKILLDEEDKAKKKAEENSKPKTKK
ncbi:MAG: hypothetical protein DSY38_00615, partial [Fusobacteria bacterium]